MNIRRREVYHSIDRLDVQMDRGGNVRYHRELNVEEGRPSTEDFSIGPGREHRRRAVQNPKPAREHHRRTGVQGSGQRTEESCGYEMFPSIRPATKAML